MRSGFTLVELSIVLVIIGLLVGGILAGRDLITTSRLNKIISELKSFDTSIQTFRLKYNKLPGDMDNATSFWGEVSASCTTQLGTGTQTCNGNGNGVIGDIVTAPEVYEVFRFWQHLANAGLIKGDYTGVAGPSTTRHSVIGSNVPKSSAMESVGFSLTTISKTTYDLYAASNYPYGYIGIFFQVGGENNPVGAGYETYGLTFTGPEVYYIDSKLDDGKPLIGKVSVYINSSVYANACASSDVRETATYANDNTKRCFFMYKVLNYNN